MIFGQRLRNLRVNGKGRKLTQKELAKELNLSESAIRMYELGEREPKFEIVELIANFFNVSTDYLLGRTDDPTPPGEYQGVPGRPYEVFFQKIKEKYPRVDITDPEVQRKLMRAIDFVLEDYEKSKQ